jgi:hypothetical protein
MQKAYGAPMKGHEDLLPTLESMVGSNSARFGELSVVLGLVILVIVGLLIWARFFRSRRRSASRRNLPNLAMRPAESRNGEERERPRSGGSRRHRHRHRHSHHEQYTNRNPTLAETGGLPPPRDEPFGPSPS